MPNVSYRLFRVRSAAFSAGTAAVAVFTLTGIVLELLGGMPPFLFVTILIPFLGMGVGFWLRRQINTKERGRGANKVLMIVTFIVMSAVILGIMSLGVRPILLNPRNYASDSLDGRPALTLRDIGVSTEPGSKSTRIGGSVAVPVQYTHWEINSEGSVYTTIHRAVSPAIARGLYNKEIKKQLDARRVPPMFSETVVLSPGEAAIWGAEEGFMIRMEDGNFHELTLRNGRTVLYLRLSRRDGSLSGETAEKAVRALFESVS